MVGPNPTRGRLDLAVQLGTQATSVDAQIFDLAGRRIATLSDDRIHAGGLKLSWTGRTSEGRTAGDGVYVCRIVAKDASEIRLERNIRFVWLK